MSHFSVSVFTDENTTVEDLLEPFDENLEVEKYLYKTKEEVIRDGKDRIQNLQRMYRAYIKNKKKYRRQYFDRISVLRYVKKIPSMSKWNNERIYKDEIEFYNPELISENGDVCSTYNPNSKWDWYEIGGRWKEMLIIEDTENKGKFINVNSARVGDIRWDLMKEKSQKSLMPYQEYIKKGCYSEEYLKERYPTEEQYMKCMSAFSTYAVLTPEGEWIAPGQMGWWGISSATPEQERNFEENFEEKFIKNVNPDWTLTIVDCHI